MFTPCTSCISVTDPKVLESLHCLPTWSCDMSTLHHFHSALSSCLGKMFKPSESNFFSNSDSLESKPYIIVSPDKSQGYYAFVIVTLLLLPPHRFLVWALHPAVLIQSFFQIQVTCPWHQGLDANPFWALCDSICGH